VSTSVKERATSAEFAAPSLGSRLKGMLFNQQTVLFLVLLALVVYFGARNSLFFSQNEFANLITDFCGLVLLAIAETYVIISGGIDLAVGSTGAIASVITAGWLNTFQTHHMNNAELLLLGTLFCAVIGAIAGAVSAVLITKFNLVPFVATLVTYSAGAGLALVISNGAPVGYNPAATIWSSSGVFVFSWLSIIIIAIAVILGLVLHLTSYGRYNFAIGSNEFAARAAGINVKRHVASVYVIAGVLAGLTGMFFYIRSGSAAATTGVTNSANLEAIAAVVIGGASLTGGVGRWAGTFLGCAVLTVVTDGLIFINVPPTWNQVIVAALIAVATVLQVVRPGKRRTS